METNDPGDGAVLCPFTLAIEPMAAMLNFEIADDPIYAGLEVQRFDDPVHGTGLVVLLVRRADRTVDVYRQPGLRLDPASYGIDGGLGEWQEAEINPALLTVTSTGSVVDIGLHDVEGRRVEVRADDRDGQPRRPAALLAPVSAAVQHPNSMLLVWMPRFDLLRAGRGAPEIVIDGRAAATGRLPMAWLHRRRLIKAAADLAVVRLNASVDGAPVGRVVGSMAVERVAAASGGHEAVLALDPPMPDLGSMPVGAGVTGAWRLDIDGTPSIVSGTWSARRDGDRVELALDSTAPWQPGPLPLLMRIVTRIVPTFRQWPRTYRWRATVILGDVPTMTSHWERTDEAGAASYGRFMRVPTR